MKIKDGVELKFEEGEEGDGGGKGRTLIAASLGKYSSTFIFRYEKKRIASVALKEEKNAFFY